SATAATPEPPSDPAPEPSSDPAQQPPSDAEVIASLDAEMAALPRDQAWESREERRLSEGLSAAAGISPASVECRGALCRARLSFRTRVELDRFIGNAAANRTLASGEMTVREEPGATETDSAV